MILALLLAACGGGGGAPPVPSLPEKLRTDLLYGYYGGDANTPLEVADHANMVMTRPWGTGGGIWLAEVMPQLQQAKGNGQRVILGLPGLYDAGGLADIVHNLQKLKDAGLLAHVVALYPYDEPDQHGKSDADVLGVNAILSDAMDQVGVNFPLAVIYNCSSGRQPGHSSYQWAGCDDYGRGCDAATGSTFASFQARLRPDQRALLVPGGADPWRQDPACFALKAHSDPQVAAIVPFIWVDNADPANGVGLGVRSNGMRAAYCRVGRGIGGGNAATC